MESSLAAPHLGTQRSQGTGWRSSGALGSGIDSGLQQSPCGSQLLYVGWAVPPGQCCPPPC